MLTKGLKAKKTYILKISNLIKKPFEMYISILDVGHGNSAILVGLEGVLVIDAGPGSSLLEYLKIERINHINVLIISHADQDHIEGIISLIESETVQIDLIKLNTDSRKKSKLWDDLLFLLDRANKYRELIFEVGLTTNDSGKFIFGDINVQLLAPSPYLAARGPGSTDQKGRRLSSNSNSAVVRLDNHKKPLITFWGDLDKVGLENIADSGMDLNVPIAVFPHHGGKQGGNEIVEFTSLFYELVKPESIIFSIGRGKYDTPQPDIIGTLLKKRHDISIYCTQISENCLPDLKNFPSDHLVDKYSKGREFGSCCSGTILICIDGDEIKISPDHDAYQDFIKNNLPLPICQPADE